MPEQTFGERVRAMRIEQNLSQEGLAKRVPGGRHLTWVSRIESGKTDPTRSDILLLAGALHVDAGWLLNGDESGDNEFIARLRGMEPLMDERGRREVLATAERQVDEAKQNDAASLLAFLEADPSIAERLAERASNSASASRRSRITRGVRVISSAHSSGTSIATITNTPPLPSLALLVRDSEHMYVPVRARAYPIRRGSEHSRCHPDTNSLEDGNDLD